MWNPFFKKKTQDAMLQLISKQEDMINLQKEAISDRDEIINMQKRLLDIMQQQKISRFRLDTPQILVYYKKHFLIEIGHFCS